MTMNRRLILALVVVLTTSAFAQECSFSFFVRKKSGDILPATDLNLRDLTISVGGKPAPITKVQRAAPSEIVILFDASGSMRDLWNPGRYVTAQIIEGLTPNSRVTLYTFQTALSLEAQGRDAALAKIEQWSDPQKIAHGQTALLESLEKALLNHHQALFIVVSDGVDNRSNYSTKKIDQVLIDNDLQVIWLALVDHKFRTDRERYARDELGSIASASGGFIDDPGIFPGEWREQLETAARFIFSAIRNRAKIEINPPVAVEGDTKLKIVVPKGSVSFRNSEFFYPNRLRACQRNP